MQLQRCQPRRAGQQGSHEALITAIVDELKC